MRLFHFLSLLCAGWGGKQKASKHICISESLVPRELLWAVSANLFSELLGPTSNTSPPPSVLFSSPLMLGQILQHSFNWCGGVWGWQSYAQISWFQMVALSPLRFFFFFCFTASQVWMLCLRYKARQGGVCACRFQLVSSWRWVGRVGAAEWAKNRSGPLSPQRPSPGQASMPGLWLNLRDRSDVVSWERVQRWEHFVSPPASEHAPRTELIGLF